MKCNKCGKGINETDKIIWKCNLCGKKYNSTGGALYEVQNKKNSIKTNILKCKKCGEYIDNGNEKIYWKCSCGNIICGKLEEYVGKRQQDKVDDSPEYEKKESNKVKDCIQCRYKIEKTNKKIIKSRLALIACVITILCLIGTNAYFIYGLNGANEKIAQITSQDKKLTKNNIELRDINKIYSLKIDGLSEECEELQGRLNKKNSELSKLKNQQTKIDALNNLLEKKDKEISELNEQLEVSKSYEENNDSCDNSDYEEKDTTDENNSCIVYVTDTGSKYHRAGCRYLWNSQNAIDINDAIAYGYTACSVCNP